MATTMAKIITILKLISIKSLKSDDSLLYPPKARYRCPFYCWHNGCHHASFLLDQPVLISWTVFLNCPLTFHDRCDVICRIPGCSFEHFRNIISAFKSWTAFFDCTFTFHERGWISFAGNLVALFSFFVASFKYHICVYIIAAFGNSSLTFSRGWISFAEDLAFSSLVFFFF